MHRARLALIAVLASGALAAPASADTYCVAPESSCAPGQTYATLQAALDQAAAHAGADKVQLGAATYTAVGAQGFVSNDVSGVLEIAGKGATTVLTAPSGASYVLTDNDTATGSSIHDLKVHLPASMASGGIGLSTQANTTNVVIDEAATQSNYHVGLAVAGGADIAHATITIPSSDNYNDGAINVMEGGSTITDVSATSRTGVSVSANGGTLLDRMRITATSVGVSSAGTSTTVRNSLVTADGMGGALYVGPGSLTVENCTLVNPNPDQTPAGVYVTGSFGEASADVSGTVIRGFTVPVQTRAQNNPASATVRYSDLDTAADVSLFGGPITLGPGNGYHPGTAAGFVDEAGGDYRLLYTSPLVDAGEPGLDAGPADVRNYERLVDGDGAGGARLDIGAYEYPRQGPELQVDAGPDTGDVGVEYSWTGSATDDDPGETPLLTYGWRVDGGAVQPGATLHHTFTSGGTHTLTLVATDPAGATGTLDYPVVIKAPAPPAPDPGAGTGGDTGSGGSVPVSTPTTTPSGGGDRGGTAPAAADTRAPQFARLRVIKGRRVAFAIDEDATVEVTLMRGRHRVLHRVLRLRAGGGAVAFPRLRTGRYRLTLRATDAAGNRSRAATRRFVRR